MRKFLFFALSAIFTAGTPAGCNTDYNAISYFVWVNDSDHKITLFVESDLGCEFKNEVILPGESLLRWIMVWVFAPFLQVTFGK